MAPISRVASRKVLSSQLGRWQNVCGLSTMVRTASHEQKDTGSSLIVARPNISNISQFKECHAREIKKDAKTELIKALQNILDVQKSLSIDDNGVWPMGVDELSDHPQSVSSWKDSVGKAINSGYIQQAIDIFYSSPKGIESSNDITIYDTYRNLIFRTNAFDTETAFDIFDASEDFYENALDFVHETYLSTLVNHRQQIIKKIIKVISQATPRSDPNSRLGQMLSYISTAIQCTTEPSLQHELYPLIMSALLKKPVVSTVTRSVKLKEIEKEIWDSAIHSLKMIDCNFVAENPRILELYNVLLSQSSYRKQKSLPFVFLMNALLDKGHIPSASVFLKIVQNEYPYESVLITRPILTTLLRLQKKKSASMPDYILDLGTVEHLSCVLSRKGNSSELIQLWEYVQEIQNAGNPHYHPTIGLYENLARAFVSSKRREDVLVFGVLATMEDQGHQPSYIFLKGLSQAMRTRSTVSRLDKASHILRNSHEAYTNSRNNENLGIRASTSALNTIISGYADLGRFDKAYSLYTSFTDLDCEPDEYTFIFLLDALHMNLSTAIPSGYSFENHDWVKSQVETADILLQESTYRGFQSGLLLEKYVSISCVVGNIDKARNIVVDMVLDAERNGQIPDITLETFSRVSLSYALSGDMQRADEMRNICIVSGYESLPTYVEKRIRRLKQKTQHQS
mmetsp:Transcript_8252/g.15544  ORF Transcript_8252/g.15544 Transcript_8252/m.15544 type:complete len:684 (-) Transcript_8252:15-2066(-)